MVETPRLQAKKSWAKGSSEPAPRANDLTFSFCGQPSQVEAICFLNVIWACASFRIPRLADEGCSISGAYPDGRFVLGRKTNRFRSVGRCTYELNPR